MAWTKEEAARVAALETAAAALRDEVARLARRVDLQAALLAHLSGRTRHTPERAAAEVAAELERDADAIWPAAPVEGEG